MMKPPDQATNTPLNTISVVETALNWKYRIMKIKKSASGSTTESVFTARS